MDEYKFDNDELTAAYEAAPRFDEGALYHSGAYSAINKRKIALLERIIAKYSGYDGEIQPLLREFAGIFYEEMELEAMHFFREGYLAGRNAGDDQ